MKPVLLFLLLPVSLYAQIDSVAEDKILQKIELGDPSFRPEDAFLRKPAVPYAHIQKKGCIYYLDSLYSGVILEPLYDSLYNLWGCEKGYLTGERMIRQRFHRDSAFCTVYYSQEALSDETMTVAYTRYYANGRAKETGTTYKDACIGVEGIFGKSDADGAFRHYYENGELESAYTKRIGKFDGAYREYFANGQLKTQRFYDLGKPVGKWLQYAETGKKTGRLTFKDEQPKGRWNGKKYHPQNKRHQKRPLEEL